MKLNIDIYFLAGITQEFLIEITKVTVLGTRKKYGTRAFVIRTGEYMLLTSEIFKGSFLFAFEIYAVQNVQLQLLLVVHRMILLVCYQY